MMNPDALMPVDAKLPCVPNVHLFDALTDAAPSSRQFKRLAPEARAICGTCEHQAPCLRINAREPGIVAGLTFHQRLTLAKGAA